MESRVNVTQKLAVSVIVCARNEEKNIKSVLEGIIAQDYDLSFVEVIVADDQSTDSTEKILQTYSNDFSFIKYFTVSGRERAKSPKKNALTQAINMAKGDIILLTDADCVPTKNWISSHVSTYNLYPETEMVAGLSKTKPKELSVAPLYQQFEYIDFLVLMFAAQGAIQSGSPFSCSGQNLSYRKESFYGVSGFRGVENYISGDDVLLMQKFVSRKKVVKFACYANAYTETLPINSWKELINQRARWASNLKRMFGMNFKFFVYLVSCFVSIGLLPFYGLFTLLIRMFFDEIFIKNALFHWEMEHSIVKNKLSALSESLFLRWYLISPIYILVVTVFGTFSLFKWKGRSGTLLSSAK